MFGALNIGGHQEARDKNRNEHEESQSFLTGDTDRSMKQPTARRCSVDTAGPWKISTAVLGLLLILLLSTELRHHVRPSYESGFNTDLRESQTTGNLSFNKALTIVEPAVSSIKLERRKFFGGIIVNESSEFELVLEPGGVRYTGRPTQELDDAWDRIVGKLYGSPLQPSLTDRPPFSRKLSCVDRGGGSISAGASSRGARAVLCRTPRST